VPTPTFPDHRALTSRDDLPRIAELVQVGLLGPALGAAPVADPEEMLPEEPDDPAIDAREE
jgi:hypothetical protein